MTLFALAFGDMPGVDTPPGQRDDIRSGTLALRVVLAHESELTPAQRARVAEVRSIPDEPDEDLMIVEPVGFMRSPTTAPRPKPPDAAARHLLEAMGKQIRQDIAARIGGDIPGTIRIVHDARNDSGGNVGMADATYASGQYAGCVIHLYPNAFEANRVPASTIAHEMIHCFQYAAYATEGAMDEAPSWLIEGSAEWAGATLTEADALELSVWPAYLAHPETDLRQRTYDAMGFYAHLDETGHSPWAVFRSMWVAGGTSEAAFVASGATDASFLDSWAASTTRLAAFGSQWDTTGPGITAHGAIPAVLPVAKAPVRLAAKPYALALYNLDISTELVRFSVSGHGMLADGNVNTIVAAASVYCTGEVECVCPAGSGPDTPIPALAAGGAVLALTGGQAGTNGTIQGLDLADFCRPPAPEPAALDACTLISDEEVAAVLGTAIERHERNDSAGFHNCIIGTARQAIEGSDTSGISYVSVTFGPGDLSLFLQGGDRPPPTTPLAGLGDLAVSIDGVGAVAVNTGPLVLFVQVVTAGVPASSAIATEMARTALGRMS